jgi:glycine/D-amino acid oxidase-like deaminating enzyme
MTDVDIAIVGGGIIGTLTALELLTRAPDARIALVERDLVGGGASRRSAGIHFPRGATARVRAMSQYSEAFYARLRAAEPTTPIHPVGMSVVADEASAAQVAEAYLPSAALLRVGGVPEPAVRIPPGTAVWSGRGCQYADVYALTTALALRLRDAVDFREGTKVTSVEPRPHAVELGLGTGERLTAGRVVLCPGPWIADPAWRDVVAPLGARVKKVVALHIEQPPSPQAEAVVFHDEDAFLLPLRYRGHWLFSFTCSEWDVAPDDITHGASAANIAEARAVLERYAPELSTQLRSGRVFCDAFSPDREPIARPLDDDGRLVFVGAANGSGYRLAPAIAREAADLLDLTPAHARSAL